jgi:uncharacterized repeat protein (TIGR01451 family)
MQTSKRLLWLVMSLALCLGSRSDVFALNYALEGLDKINSTNWSPASAWSSVNLQDWKELDYIPIRVVVTGDAETDELIITFPHFNGDRFGFQNLYFTLSNSPNVMLIGDPVLTAVPVGDWSYTLTVKKTDTATGYIYFYARLAAGARDYGGSSLHLEGPELTPLQIHKPAPGPGLPDLAITKTGPATAAPGAVITYTITYTNKSTTDAATGVQITDILPDLVTFVDASNGGTLAGNTLSFDIFNVAAGGSGSVTYRVQVASNAMNGQTFTNNAMILGAEEDNNLSDNRSSVVTTVISTPITLTCATNKTVELGTTWVFDPPTFSGGCVSNLTVVVLDIVTNTSGFCGNTFSATRTWQASDICGNTASCSQTVTVVDTTSPEIHCAPNKQVELGTPWDFDAPTVSDLGGTNVVIAILGTVTNTVAHCGLTFDATRTWAATDPCGNTNTCSQTVTIVDTTPPVIVCAPDRFVEFGTAWNFDLPTTTDLNGVTLTVITTITNITCGNTLVAMRTWLATDACGNTNTCSQTVTVRDTTPPTIMCAPDKFVELGVSWDFDAPITSDANGVTVTVLNTVTNFTCGVAYTATRTWLATDNCNNTNVCSQTVTVRDTTPPVIVCAPNQFVEFGTPWIFEDPTVTDLNTVRITILGTVTNMTCGGAFTAIRTWLATDACDNTNTCSQTVTVRDTTSPTVQCAPNKTVEVGTAWGFDPPTASDTNGVIITVLNTVTNALCGNGYAATRTWLVTDPCNNTNTCSQTVTVSDTTPPSVSIISPSNSSVFIYPATFNVIASASDPDGAVSNVLFLLNGVEFTNITTAPFFFTFSNAAPGTYQFIAVATDNCGLSATSAPVTVSVVTNVIMVNGPIVYNRMNGYFEQYVTVSNRTSETWANGVRVFVGNVFSPTKVVNATGTNENGTPYLDNHNSIPPGGSANILIQYFVPFVLTPPDPKLTAVPLPFDPPMQAPEITKVLPTVSMLDVRFKSQAGRIYFMQYSEDFVHWTTDSSAIRGTGGVMAVPQHKPGGKRFYRVLMMR